MGIAEVSSFSSKKQEQIIERLTAIETKLDTNKDLFVQCTDNIGKNVETTVESMNATIKGNTESLSASIKSINDSLVKVMYALVGIIAATVGIQFKPNSPVNWMLGFDQTTRFLGVFAALFLSLMLWRAYRDKSINNKNPKWLVAGLQALALSLGVTAVFPLQITDLFWLILPFRLAYSICFIAYAWKLH